MQNLTANRINCKLFRTTNRHLWLAINRCSVQHRQHIQWTIVCQWIRRSVGMRVPNTKEYPQSQIHRSIGSNRMRSSKGSNGNQRGKANLKFQKWFCWNFILYFLVRFGNFHLDKSERIKSLGYDCNQLPSAFHYESRSGLQYPVCLHGSRKNGDTKFGSFHADHSFVHNCFSNADLSLRNFTNRRTRGPDPIRERWRRSLPSLDLRQRNSEFVLHESSFVFSGRWFQRTILRSYWRRWVKFHFRLD